MRRIAPTTLVAPTTLAAFAAFLFSLAAWPLPADEPPAEKPAAPTAAAGDAADEPAAGKTPAKKGGQREGKQPGAKPRAETPVDFPRKIVLIAGPKDERHGPGTHEYEATVRTIQEALEASNVADKVRVEVVLNGWPEDPATLDDAGTIFLVSAGSDHKETDQPFLVGDRMQVLEKQMDRGCGLVLLHWSVFVPIKYEEQITRWVGGFFDYQRGDDPRGWHSAITFATAKIHPNQKHAIGKGVPPFEHRDEYYYRIRFDKDDKRVTPIVTVTLPEVEEPQVVAWAVERKDGGRGFVFTGGHFQKSWDEEPYRKLLLNAICWTAKVPVPAGGVHKELAFDDQWTPKPHLGKEDLPKEKEADWVDGRIRDSATGPTYTASIVVPDSDPASKAFRAVESFVTDDSKPVPAGDMVTKALAIKLGGEEGLPPAAVLFDKETMTLRCGWTGGFLNHSDRRYGLLEMPTIGEEVVWSVGDSTWLARPSGDQAYRGQHPASVEYDGLRLSGEQVALSYSVEGCDVTESPSLAKFGDETAFVRTFEFGPAWNALELPIVAWPGSSLRPAAKDGMTVFEKDGEVLALAPFLDPASQQNFLAVIPKAGDSLNLIVRENGVRTSDGQPGVNDETELLRRVAVAIWWGPKDRLPAFIEAFRKAAPQAESLAVLVEDPAPRWGEPLVTKGEIGTSEADSPFAVDTITIPYENRFKALFFMGGFDFAPDGVCYACTAHGDVWKVTGIDEDLDEITWQRFATGLYQPLGLKVRDGEVFVLGRDQITRLHDTNGDGEADFYENFNDDLTDHGQAHAYAMCLETDAAGNFYFLKSGAPATPHGGTLLKLSADGQTLEVHATGFRHPNGLGVGPDGTITAADNEGNWVPVTRIDIVEQGEFCGHVPTAHVEPEPAEYDLPLCWLPRVVDNSAGGQVWVPEGAWGPLAGEMLHLSYGQCTASQILKEQVEGVWQGGAVRLPVPEFLSGVCRGRFRTAGDGADGHLYVCGLDGWSTSAAEDGNLQRVRYVGGPLLLPTALHVHENSLELTFPEPLDRELAGDPARYAVNVWNYHWTAEYGSKDYSVADPTREGRDALKVASATLSDDGRRVFLAVEGLRPVMQLRVQAGLRTAAGAKLPVNYYGTVHRLRSSGSGTAGNASAAGS